MNTQELQGRLLEAGLSRYRDLPWRYVDSPYAVLVSEVMLQQTQVSRVDGRWQRWMKRFPTVDDLAHAPLAAVLEEWQGMGYNRRAMNLQRCAQQLVELHDGQVPSDSKALVALPGIGPATAAGIRAFAFDLPAIYLETNVRAVMIHECFPGRDDVSDKEIVPLLEDLCPKAGHVRQWYYALLDYGAWLKKAFPNPSRRSSHHSRQSKFEGSHRQKRAFVLRLLLRRPCSAQAILSALNDFESSCGRKAVEPEELQGVMEELNREGFIAFDGSLWAPRS